MRLEKAAGPADQALVDHGGFGGLFLSVTGRYWSFPLIFRMNAGRLGFPGGSVVKNLPANAGDAGDASSIPGSGRYPGVGKRFPLQYSCLENSMDRKAWWAIVSWGHK